MIQRYHYSNTLPNLNKYFIGFYLLNELVGVVTLGWGTRPRHTIQKVFPSLNTKDYLEIGRMCMSEEMEKNSESQMLSQLVKWLRKNHPEVKILFTWADGMLGKVGYVYQAANFIYAGYSGGEMYIKDGVKIHVRQMKSILIPHGTKDPRKTVRPTLKQMKEFNISHFKGKQFRYLFFLCGRKERKRLMKECCVKLDLPRPKEKDLSWTTKDVESGKWVESSRPPYITDINRKTKDIVNIGGKICDICGKRMKSGFVIYDNDYFCSEKCLHKKYTPEEYEQIYANDDGYWTEWEENDEVQQLCFF